MVRASGDRYEYLVGWRIVGGMRTMAPDAMLKRWKVGSAKRTIAKHQEALIKMDLMKGTIKSEYVQRPTSFDSQTERYLAALEIKK